MNRNKYNRIVSQIVDRYGITKEELYENTKSQDVVQVRYLLFYVCARKGFKPATIIRMLSGDGFKATHSTVARGIKIMEDRVMNDIDYKQIVNQIN